MVVINYDSNPKNSIYLSSALLYWFIVYKSNNYLEAREYFKNNINNNDAMFFYSLDWLFLMEKVKSIKDGVIECV